MFLTIQKALAFTLCLSLLLSGSLCALAAKSVPKTAEELDYLPAEVNRGRRQEYMGLLILILSVS